MPSCGWPRSRRSRTPSPPTRQRYLPRMLDDPVRAVRIEAARALAGRAGAGTAADDQRARSTKALAEYVAVQTYNADRPEGRMSLGNLYAQRGDAGRAIAEYRKALAIDPTFVAGLRESRRSLSRARRGQRGRDGAARGHRARPARRGAASRAGPRARAPEAQAPKASQEFEAAAQARARQRRYAYVYAVALHDAGPGRGGAEGAGRRVRAPSQRPRRAVRPRAFQARRRATARRRWATSGSCASSIPTMPSTRRCAKQIEGAPKR